MLQRVCSVIDHRCRLPPFSLIRDFGKQNTRGKCFQISDNHTCYRQIGSKSTYHSPLAWRKEGLKVTLVAVIGRFRSNLLITRKTDGIFGNVSAGVLFSKVAYQRNENCGKGGTNKKVAHEAIAECATDVLTTFWRLLWSISDQTHGNMESICFI